MTHSGHTLRTHTQDTHSGHTFRTHTTFRIHTQDTHSGHTQDTHSQHTQDIHLQHTQDTHTLRTHTLRIHTLSTHSGQAGRFIESAPPLLPVITIVSCCPCIFFIFTAVFEVFSCGYSRRTGGGRPTRRTRCAGMMQKPALIVS